MLDSTLLSFICFHSRMLNVSRSLHTYPWFVVVYLFVVVVVVVVVAAVVVVVVVVVIGCCCFWLLVCFVVSVCLVTLCCCHNNITHDSTIYCYYNCFVVVVAAAAAVVVVLLLILLLVVVVVVFWWWCCCHCCYRCECYFVEGNISTPDMSCFCCFSIVFCVCGLKISTNRIKHDNALVCSHNMFVAVSSCLGHVVFRHCLGHLVVTVSYRLGHFVQFSVCSFAVIVVCGRVCLPLLLKQ